MKYIKILTISAVFLFSSISSVYSEETKLVKDLRDKIKTIFQEYEDLFFKKTIVKPDNDKDKEHDKKDCPCGGDGIITHGDGHTTPCPCDLCNCKKKGDEQPPKKEKSVVSKPTIIMLSQTFCPPCQLWKRQKMEALQIAGWNVQVLNLNIPKEAEIAKLMGLSADVTPKFYITLNNKQYVKQGILEYSDLENYNKDAISK